ncbi:hypothetical protein L7F22_012281 [Adiantum nelumboides]|nr:hypothetical protein [Adiantum nelumboides]
MEAGAADLKQCPPEHREWVHRLRHGGSMPLSTIQLDTVSNSWACPPGDLFHVRGADYMKSKTKVPAGDWLLQPLAFEFLQASSPISHFMSHPQCRVRAALDAATTTDASQPQHAPFVWVLNFQLGQKTHHSMVLYFASFSTPPPGSLMQKFLDGDDAYRTSHLKVLLRFPEAPRLVQMVVGERVIRPCPHCHKAFIRCLPLIVSDIAFLLEGNHPDELPERILGAVRLIKLDAASAPFIDMSLVSQGNGLNFKHMPAQMFVNDLKPEATQGGKIANNKQVPKGRSTVKLSKIWSATSAKDLRKEIEPKRSANAEEEE